MILPMRFFLWWRNSGGESGNLWTDREADRAGEEFQIGGGSVVTCRELWEVSLPSGGEPYGEAGTGVDRAGVAAERGRSYSERKWLCRFEEIFVGMLILERVYNDKENLKRIRNIFLWFLLIVVLVNVLRRCIAGSQMKNLRKR